MLLSVKESFDQVTAVLRVKWKDDKLDRINKSLLSQLLSFLEEFKDATKRLEGVKTPTIHLVVLSLAQMTKTCDNPTGGDPVCTHPEVIKLRGIVKTVLIAKFKLHKIHIAAAFLDPRQTSRLLNDHRVDHSLLNEGLEWSCSLSGTTLEASKLIILNQYRPRMTMPFIAPERNPNHYLP